VGTIPAGNLSGAALLAGGNAFTGTQTVNSGSGGIGTASPATPLDVTGSASGVTAGASVSNSVFVRVNNAATDGGLFNSDVAGIGFGHDSTRQAIVGGTYGNDYLDFYTGGALTAPKMRIDFNGNVGIGTSGPAALLDVNGSGHFNGNVGIGTTSPNYPLSFANGLGDKLALYDNGNGTSYGFGIQGSQFQIHADHTNSDIVFGTGSSTNLNETMRIKGNGKVGIGVTSPAAALDVAGDAHLTGKISSPMWRTTVINYFGPLSYAYTNTFTSGGGTLLIFSSGSGYSSSTGIWIGMQIFVDSASVDGTILLNNLANTHQAFPQMTTVLTGIAAGTHTLQIWPWDSHTTTDNKDYFKVTIVELPF
jgi:hypothetical protein